jgi:hypothetical protein
MVLVTTICRKPWREQMANWNVRITNPKGEERNHFPVNHSKEGCEKWIEEYGPAPIGWKYELVNTRPNRRKYPLYTLLRGFDAGGDLVDERKTHIKHNNGRWYTPKMAKRDARMQGAIWFKREKVWSNGKG